MHHNRMVYIVIRSHTQPQRTNIGSNRRIVTLLCASVVLSVLAMVSSLSSSVAAAAPDSITLSPVGKRFEIEAGATRKDSFKVINDGQSAYNFTVYARPYSVKDELYTPDFSTDKQNADVFRWVQFDKSSYRLEAGGSVDVTYTVRVPANASPGGHYGVLFAETQPSNQTQGNAVERKKRVGSILYVTVDGDVKTGGRLLSTSVPFFQFGLPLTARQRVQNSGNTDFLVKNTMTVSDMFGQKKFVGEREVPVLPATTRDIAFEWPSANWLGVYRVDLRTTFLDTKNTSTQYVFMMPVWVYLVVALLIGARIAYAVSRHKRKA